MRKGADVLSKWVGEAERQLRMLFEEAQRQQPAIIFFDEIDGLAPVSNFTGATPFFCFVSFAAFHHLMPGISDRIQAERRL